MTNFLVPLEFFRKNISINMLLGWMKKRILMLLKSCLEAQGVKEFLLVDLIEFQQWWIQLASYSLLNFLNPTTFH